MATILMVYGSREGQTRKIVEFLAAEMGSSGHRVEVVDAASSATEWRQPEPDAVLLAGSVQVGRHSPALITFAKENRPLLDSLPTAFLSVSLAPVKPGGAADARQYVEGFLTETGWSPGRVATAAGALRYRRYSFLKRLLVRRIARREGLPTDTSRDHEFTDWAALRGFAADFLAEVERAVPA
jgi:menaquinone-dependent protoporphyrinogen oxidase